MKKKLAIISSHPIQYNAPLFKIMAQSKSISIKVFYTWGQAQGKVYDPGFGKERQWDIPLLEGYEHTFVKNTSAKPGSHHFKGIINPTLINEIEQYNPDALLVYGWSFKSHLKVMRHFHKRVPVIFRGDSNLLDEQKGWSVKKMARRILLKWVYCYVDYALYVGLANKNYFLKAGLKESQLFFAPHAVNNAHFYDIDGKYAREAEEWKKELGIKDDELVFLFAGKLESKKDPELLVNSFKEVANNRCKLIMAGNGVLEPVLKKMMQGNKQVVFLPFQNQSKMPALYRLADVFVLPSKGPGETWGLAVNEAMACSKAVIVSDRCGCAADLIVNGENGFIFESGNRQQLNEKLTFFLRNPLAKEFGEKSLHKIQNWNYHTIAAAAETIILS